MTPGEAAPGVVRAARLVVIDESGWVLLFRHDTDRGPCWATPGGRLEPGESFADAAAREACEELEIDASPTAVLWDESVEFIARGPVVPRHQRYFRIDVRRASLPALEGLAARRADEGVTVARWWSVEELSRTRETVFPAELGERVRQLARSGVEWREEGEPE